MNILQRKYYMVNARLYYYYGRYFGSRKIKRDLKRSTTFMNLSSIFEKVSIPSGTILLLHVGLKQIKHQFGGSYAEITKTLIEIVEQKYQPSAIVVPTFTWSFINSGIFSCEFSRSETGAFSENFRNLADFRTPNAIQSFCIKGNTIQEYINLNHADTFASDGIYEYLRTHDTFIIDINTDTFRASPLHHIERRENLDYLAEYSRMFAGYQLDGETRKKLKQYHGGTFIYANKYLLNKEKIKKHLVKKKVLKVVEEGGINIAYIYNNDLYDCVQHEVRKNPYYLITF